MRADAAPARPIAFDGRRAALAARASFLVIVVWIALTMAFHAWGMTRLYAAFDLPFHFLCHRMPERILSIGGVPMPMCSRCAGIWVGMSLSAAAAWPPVSIRALRIIFPIAAALMALEVFTQDMGWHPVFHPTRVLTGLLVSVPFGGALGALITRELARSAEAPSRDAGPPRPPEAAG
ncbi:MAG TPA: DUF2085 domain-containing protein [Minicystis sp.]|nr:DUF2085 domain-containing protein [Minicystis sp.]